ncbi:fimbrin-5 [Iris pallida]|uniref:4-alpha-glucanotransferase n=1 Tax=Iris pallida TaxID=29817 RepID=A0AAX6I9A5_IRIPA|nr:fimbrin-5 [Iris pallida]
MFGKWKAGPGKAFFDAISKAVEKIDLIAEDLGVITEDVVQLRKSIRAHGMAVLQSPICGSDNPHLPHNHEQYQVVYTGTHDNDTTVGWWANLKQEERQTVSVLIACCKESRIWSLMSKRVFLLLVRPAPL